MRGHLLLSTPVISRLVLLVALSWAFLMHPPSWLNRALLAFSLPTLIVLLLWGGPATAWGRENGGEAKASPPLFSGLMSAVSYSPTPCRVQYHRRWRA